MSTPAARARSITGRSQPTASSGAAFAVRSDQAMGSANCDGSTGGMCSGSSGASFASACDWSTSLTSARSSVAVVATVADRRP